MSEVGGASGSVDIDTNASSRSEAGNAVTRFEFDEFIAPRLRIACSAGNKGIQNGIICTCGHAKLFDLLHSHLSAMKLREDGAPDRLGLGW